MANSKNNIGSRKHQSNSGFNETNLLSSSKKIHLHNHQQQPGRANKRYKALTSAKPPSGPGNNEYMVSRLVSQKSTHVESRRNDTVQQQYTRSAQPGSPDKVLPTQIDVSDHAPNDDAHDEPSEISESQTTTLSLPNRTSIRSFTKNYIFPALKFPTATDVQWSTDVESICHYTITKYNIAPDKAHEFWNDAKKVISAKLIKIRNDKNSALRRAFMGKSCSAYFE